MLSVELLYLDSDCCAVGRVIMCFSRTDFFNFFVRSVSSLAIRIPRVNSRAISQSAGQYPTAAPCTHPRLAIAVGVPQSGAVLRPHTRDRELSDASSTSFPRDSIHWGIFAHAYSPIASCMDRHAGCMQWPLPDVEACTDGRCAHAATARSRRAACCIWARSRWRPSCVAQSPGRQRRLLVR